jgi:DNA-binding response OmpR family regulator
MALILLLEADRQLAKNTADFIRRQGHDVLQFTDPQSAISATDNNQPELIILNLSLAARSGIEFLYELRSYPDWQDIPVIATGRLNPAEQAIYSQAFSQLNISSYLPKESYSLSGLVAAVEQLLQPAGP